MVTISPSTGNEDKDVETWQNAGRGRVVVKKFSYSGKLADHIVKSQAKITLTPHERRLNQEWAIDEKLDPFQNGTFMPVRLVETAEDLDQIQSNPNLMTEDEMRELLGKHFKQLEARLADVQSETVVRRMREIAEAEDVTIGKIKVIDRRLEDFKPEFATEEPQQNPRA